MKAILATTTENAALSAKSINGLSCLNRLFRGKLFGVEKSKDFFNLALDAIFICSPASTHLYYIEQAIHHNMHVFVEKPLITSQSLGNRSILSASNIIKMANARGLLLTTNCQRVAAIKDLTKSLDFPYLPHQLMISLHIGSTSSVLPVHSLFDLLISHAISLMVKLGLNNPEKIIVYKKNSFYKKNISRITINGSFQGQRHEVFFTINLKQSEGRSATTMLIGADNKCSISFSTKPNEFGRQVVEYKKGESVKYSCPDHLTTFVHNFIDSVIYPGKIKPLISNKESFLIFSTQQYIKTQLSW